ncbi:type IV pilin protein [Microbulbifer sp. CnH-101-G]|uniref:type IV pilin protein n=1 Tax=Microbulbifer sp. CnH-101-G TaxID=3243393 RepID=UPI004039BD66
MMDINKPSNNRGFTLIELMIVVAIVGIIAGIAYPSYMESVRKSNRAEAKVFLNDTAQRLQRCFTAYSAYNDDNCSVAGDISGGNSLDTENGYYSITGVLTATTFTLSAKPVSTSMQGGDSGCTDFTLNQAGVKNASGKNAANCW